MLTLSKSPFPSLPITVSSLRCNTVAQPDITHQQERQIPALRDSCFMPRITNWIVWGSIIYLNTKMQSYSHLFYEVSNSILIYAKCCVRKCFGKHKNDQWMAMCFRDSYFIGSYRKWSHVFCSVSYREHTTMAGIMHFIPTCPRNMITPVAATCIICHKARRQFVSQSCHLMTSKQFMYVLGVWYVALVLCANT